MVVWGPLARQGVVMRRLRQIPLTVLPIMALLLGACEEDTIQTLVASGTFEPDTLDFGEVSVGTGKALMANLTNNGQVPISVDSYTLPEAFSLRGLKQRLQDVTLGVGESVELQVVFLPMAPGMVDDKLVIVAGELEIELKLKANATMRPLPVMAVDPQSLDFGTVAVNTTATAQIRVTNMGTGDGVIDSLNLQSHGGSATMNDDFYSTTSFPLTVPVDGEAMIEVVFAPKTAGMKADTLVLAANQMDPLQVTVTGEGIIPQGDLVCAPARVDFGKVERGSTADQMVTCTAQGGPVRLISAATQDSAIFPLANTPTTEDLMANDSRMIGVRFVSMGMLGARQGTLQVMYSGANGPATATVNLVAEVEEPPPTATAISLQLTWNTNRTDLDIHFLRPRAIPFSPLGGDCYFANMTPDWGMRGYTPDDCFLDRDDIDGLGPEIVNLTETAPGDYQIWVHYFQDNRVGPTNATVDVYIGGQQVGSFTRPNMNCNDMWFVGTISWNGTSGTFNQANMMSRSNRGQCS